MLRGGYAQVMQARSREEFRGEVLRFTQRMGFDTVSAITVIDRGVGKSEFITVDNTPENFALPYRDLDSCRRDPVLQHCKHQSVPIIWDRQTYLDNGAEDLWEEQAHYGYRTGIAMALHRHDGKHFLLGVDRDQPLPEDPDELQRVVADLQLFAVHAQEAAVRLLVPQHDDEPPRPSLTPRELEALRWTSEGKTAWEVGAVLGITERTAVLHVHNAMRKLGCCNKLQAVLKAVRLGLID
jgi:DNA-binding CsgD family transcriptional regulator